jgi:hypothetical protein
MWTSISVESEVKERLAVMAREKGMTIAQMLTDMVGLTPTPEQLAERAAATRAYLQEHFGVTDEDLAESKRFWQELQAGRTPKSLDELYQSEAAA